MAGLNQFPRHRTDLILSAVREHHCCTRLSEFMDGLRRFLSLPLLQFSARLNAVVEGIDHVCRCHSQSSLSFLLAAGIAKPVEPLFEK